MLGSASRIAVIAGVALGAAGLSLTPASSQPAEPSGQSSRAAPDLNRQAPPAQTQESPLAAPLSGNACPFGGQGLTVNLTKVVVDGATVISQAEVDAAVSDLVGGARDLGVVCEARDRVAALFARKGYRLTRVDLPPQTISDGVLRLQATEGFVSNVDTEGLSRMGPSAALARSYLNRLQGKRPTPWSDIERAVLLAREIPGADVSVRIHAAQSAPGAVEVVATARKRRQVDLSVGLQHLGGDELGRTAVYGRLDANSFTRWGDRTSVVFFTTTTGDQRVFEGVESFNVGTQGLRAQGEIDYAVTDPGGALAPLQIHGNFLDVSGKLDYPFVRTQAFSAFGGVRFDYINQKNNLGILRGIVPGEPLLFQDKLRLLTVNGDLRFRPEALTHVEADISAQLVQGVGGMGGSHKGDLNLSRVEADPKATVLRADGSVRWTASPRRTFSQVGGLWIELRGSAQYANTALPAYEEFQIGNYTIGRGYSPGAASGDRGIGGQAEAGWRVPYGGSGGKAAWKWVEPYVFVDGARLKNLDTGGYTSSVVSVGGGLRALLPFELLVDVAYAKPLDRPFPGAAKPDGRLLLKISRVFSFH